ncbi:MAG: type III pantothenate kinase [Bacteroidia bacterium]|nr:type III pantothenate kinase [Bacteroidia bacterium]MBT8288428.1 type III pantothenate kinase [Bacteroidia bacterium]
MNLIIDVGNSKVKLAIYSKGRLLKKDTVSYARLKTTLLSWIADYPGITKAILASVGPIKSGDFKYLSDHFDLHILSSASKLPFKNRYNTPKTLGVDRLAVIAAASQHYAMANVLVIDAGSCITFDFINDKNEYLGGSISPGISLRYKALNTFTANLPLLEPKAPRQLIGKSTNSAIHAGVIYGVLNELDGVIDEYRSNWSDLTVILTGGDAKLLSKRLKNSIFANPNFLLDGLNFILEFNTRSC